MKVLANDGISEEGKVALEKAGYTVITDKVAQDQLIDFVNANQIEILLVRSATTIRKEVIDACPRLKLLGRGGVGMDNIDVAYAREKGLHVINTPASSSQSVAELVMGHLFAGSRFLHNSFKEMETGDFSELKKRFGKGRELRGKAIAIIGFGRIGQSLASYALGCGMKVIAVNNDPLSTDISLGEIQGFGEVKVHIESTPDMHNALKEADFISLHVPKQPNGSAVISDAEFALMKKGVVLVNAARGGVVDEQALLRALDNGTVSYAGLDVYENEPNPMKELLAHPRIGNTPHIGAATTEAQDRIGLELAATIIKTFGPLVCS